MAENNENNSVRPQNKNLKPPLKKGETANPNGRPKGQRNYATIYREALIKIADANNKTPEEIETMLEETGLKQGLKGNFQFWKDIRDRIHGQPVQKAELTTKLSFDDETKEKASELIKEYLGANRE